MQPQLTEELRRQSEPPPMDAASARALTDKIRHTLTIGDDLIIQAFQGRAWIALGYLTFDEYCLKEFADLRMIRLPRDQRRDKVTTMTGAGMSTRAIGSALGVHHDTVASDARANLAPVGNPTRDSSAAAPVATPVTGLDGKRYRPREASKVSPIRDDNADRREPEEVQVPPAVEPVSTVDDEPRPPTPIRVGLRPAEAATLKKMIVRAESGRLYADPPEARQEAVELVDRWIDGLALIKTALEDGLDADGDIAAPLIPQGRKSRPKTRRRFDSNRIIEATVSGAEPSLLEFVDYAALDQSRIDGWVSSLTTSIRGLHGVRNRLADKRNGSAPPSALPSTTEAQEASND